MATKKKGLKPNKTQLSSSQKKSIETQMILLLLGQHQRTWLEVTVAHLQYQLAFSIAINPPLSHHPTPEKKENKKQKESKKKTTTGKPAIRAA